jgi:hypothetical protein
MPPMPPPPRRETTPSSGGSSRPFLLMLLAIACLLLGALLAWGMGQRGERARLSVRNVELANAYVAVLAKRDDLAGILTDPRTRLYTLQGRNAAAGLAVTVAWQEQTHTGVLVGDRMPLPPDDRAYTLWRVDAGQSKPTPAVTFRPDSARTIQEFHVTSSEGAGSGGFRVSVEKGPQPKGPPAPADVVYESSAAATRTAAVVTE